MEGNNMQIKTKDNLKRPDIWKWLQSVSWTQEGNRYSVTEMKYNTLIVVD